MFLNFLAMYKDYKFKKKIAKSPLCLDDALLWLMKNLGHKGLAEIKESTDGLHFGLGMYLRNEWGLWYPEHSRLAKHFVRIGIDHADDMSSIIFESLHRKLNNLPIDLDGQVKEYKEYWNEMRKVQGSTNP